MATATLDSLGGRLASQRPASPRAAGPGRHAEADRALRLAPSLFAVGTAALVVSGPDGLRVVAIAGPGPHDESGAIEAARQLFEALAASEAGRPGGVMEAATPGRGFRAATPVMSADGRRRGALCLVDGGRRALLSPLQRRLLGQFGDLLAPALDVRAEGSAAAEAGDDATLRNLADAELDAVALFDAEGRCMLRNRAFDALFGTAPAEAGGFLAPAAAAAARGAEPAWLALHLARDLDPVGVYRAAVKDGTWLAVEERRGPGGRSLVGRLEARDGFGSGTRDLLFERCPFPMFVFDRETRAILAANAAALTLYGWDREGFMKLDLEGIGAVGLEPAAAVGAAGWVHRRRDGRALAVSGRTTGLDHGGRPAVLVTVTMGDEDGCATAA